MEGGDLSGPDIASQLREVSRGRSPVHASKILDHSSRCEERSGRRTSPFLSFLTTAWGVEAEQTGWATTHEASACATAVPLCSAAVRTSSGTAARNCGATVLPTHAAPFPLTNVPLALQTL